VEADSLSIELSGFDALAGLRNTFAVAHTCRAA
jgi:hypothetical protein